MKKIKENVYMVTYAVLLRGTGDTPSIGNIIVISSKKNWEIAEEFNKKEMFTTPSDVKLLNERYVDVVKI